MRRVVIVLLIGLVLGSCSSELAKEDFIGTWEVSDYVVKSEVLDEDVIAAGKEVALEMEYVFEEDGSLLIDWGGAAYDNVKVLWDYDEKDKILVISGEGQTSNFDIVSYEDDKITWIEDMGELGTTEVTVSRVE